ncbi:MAG: hypothetical protein Q8T09_06790 [Candidatus Melainabacteria bacterium]|nr:hypothetical protein [Candidatus Melainabacteria bacterium]
MTDAPDKGRKTDEVQDAATQKLLEGLGNQVAQARYGQVAPAFNPGAEPGKGRDPYYVGPADGKPQRAPYGADSPLLPGGNPRDGNPPAAREEVPNFRDQHKDKQVDPNKPYARSDIGEQVRTGNNPQGQGRQFSWQGADFFDPRVQQTIMLRGQHRDLLNSTIFAGAASVPIPLLHGAISRQADQAVAKAAETGGESRFGKWWQNNADPSKYSTSDLLKTDQRHVQAFQDFEGLQTKLAKAVEAGGDDAAKAAEKLDFLKTRSAAGSFTPQSLMEASAKEGGKFFDGDELKILEGRVNAGKMIDAAATKQSNRIAQILDNTPGWMSRVGTGMLSSAVQYGIVSTDRGMTEKVAGATGLHESWNASQFIGPMALAALPGRYKLLAPVAAIGGSQAVDGFARITGLTAPDRFNAATGVYDGWNGAFVAGSLTLATYAKNPWAKATIAGVGTLAPVLAHAYQDNIGGNLKGGVENVRESISYDHNKRSYGSLREVDSSMQKVLNKKEDWIVANVDASFAAMNDRWNKPLANGGLTTEQKLLGLRDDASATGALSRNILDKGTRISDKGSEPQYMLDGYQLDVGGRSLHYMLRTRNSADKAAVLTEQIIRDNADPNKQVTIKGELPKQSEADDLRKYSAEAQTDITKILDGKHDIRGAYAELVKDAEVLDKEFLKTYIKGPDNLILYYNDKASKAQAAAQRAAAEGNEPLRQEAELKTQEYAKVVAKLYRDQALAYMAMAEAKMKNGKDGGGAYDLLIDDGVNRKDIFPNGMKKGYNGAQGALRIADTYSPGNPDTQQLAEIFSELVKKMEQERKLQLTSSSSNVLGFRDQFTRPSQ